MPTCSEYRLFACQRVSQALEGRGERYARYATVSDGSLLKCSDSMKRSSKFQLMEYVSSVANVEQGDSHRLLAMGFQGICERSQRGLKSIEGLRASRKICAMRRRWTEDGVFVRESN